ncbi:hypothetical protein BV898_02348 [Hypsibius exemplaris]|uniref:Uncharacterized protein n=1 Tax=Hypsibius exemplaris TaxID=2072580 RepID=A0A1W0X8F2_HYPEX|nr:hypothetical protein BV898_02348 [Hypsibius exemplaris]
MASTRAAMSDVDRFTKRIYDCVVTNVLVHRSLTALELEQAFYQDYEPMFLSEALLKAGFATLADFACHYPNELRVNRIAYSGGYEYFTPGPNVPALLEDNIRLIRTTESHKRPNPNNREKGIMGSTRIKWKYDESARQAKLSKPAVRPSVPGNSPPGQAVAPAELEVPPRCLPLLTPVAVPVYQPQALTNKNTVPSVDGSRNYLPVAHPMPYRSMSTSTEILPQWYNEPVAGLLPTPQYHPGFLPRAVFTQPMTKMYAAQSADFRQSGGALPPPPIFDSDESDDGFAVPVVEPRRVHAVAVDVTRMMMPGVVQSTPIGEVRAVVKPMMPPINSTETVVPTSPVAVFSAPTRIADKRLEEILKLGSLRLKQSSEKGFSSTYEARIRMYRQLREYNSSRGVPAC